MDTKVTDTKTRMVQRTIFLLPEEMQKLDMIVERSVIGVTISDVIREMLAQVPDNVRIVMRFSTIEQAKEDGKDIPA